MVSMHTVFIVTFYADRHKTHRDQMIRNKNPRLFERNGGQSIFSSRRLYGTELIQLILYFKYPIMISI